MEDDFAQVETQEVQPPRFSAFPGAGVVQTCRGLDKGLHDEAASVAL